MSKAEAKLENLEVFAELTGGWFWSTDREHRFVYVSQSIESATGLTPDRFYGRTRQEIGIPDQVSESMWREHLASLDRHEPFEGFVFQYVGPRGLIWLQTSGSPIFDEFGDFLGYQGVTVNITKRIIAEEKTKILIESIDQIDQYFAIWDKDDRLLFYNDNVRKVAASCGRSIVVGESFEEHITNNVKSGLIDTGSLDAAAWIAARLISHERPKEQIELRRIDGSCLLIHEQKTSSGATVTSATDITSIRKAEVEIRQLAGAIEEFNESFALWGPDGRLIVCNRKFRALTNGYRDLTRAGIQFQDFARALASSGLLDLGAMTTEEWVVERLRRFEDPGEPFEVLRKDGKTLLVVEHRLANGSIASTLTDVTKMKQAIAERALAHQRLVDAVEALPVGFLLYDRDDQLVMSNWRIRVPYGTSSIIPELGETYEYHVRQNARRGIFDFGELSEEAWVAKRLEEHDQPTANVVLKLKGDRWVQVVQSRTSDGGSVGFRMDISQLKQQQAQLEAARAEAEAASRAKSEFLAMISHEIRTPLNGILGMAYLLRDPGMNAEQSERLENIIASGVALQAIINDVLDMSKIEAGALDLEVVSFDMLAIVKNVTTLFDGVAVEKGLSLEVAPLPESARYLIGDPSRIRQILWNLLSNAVKFTRNGGVSVEFDHDRSPVSDSVGCLQITVSDTGIGIEPMRLDSIFDPFIQADVSTSRRFGGTGLGLSIIRNLIDLMGGTISVESEPGAGTTFQVELPLGTASVEDVEPQESRTKSHAGSLAQSLNVLVAEDHPLNAMVTTEMLQRNGHVSTHVTNGREAVEALEAAGYDLVLMDARMPEMDGIEATRLIRSRPELAAVPIVGLTADAFLDQHEALRAAGMNAVVTKPFTEHDLLAAVRKYGTGNADKTLLSSEKAGSVSDWKIAATEEFRAFALNRNEKQVLALLDLAIDTTANGVAKLRASMAKRDHDTIYFVAHTLRGSTGSLFASNLSEVAGEIAADPKDEDRIVALVEEVEAAAAEAIGWWSDMKREISEE